MSYSVLFTPSADVDLEDAFKWYESQKPLLGWEFRENVSHCIDKIMNDRVDYQVYADAIRKIKLERFPYKLYYLKDSKEKEITVLALFHIKRNPEEIKKLV
jgi:plasmid stabilization system protein ParE